MPCPHGIPYQDECSWIRTPPICGACTIDKMKNRIKEFELLEEKLRRQIRELTFEVEVLRLYGNKDCTAMADTRLKEEKDKGGPFRL